MKMVAGGDSERDRDGERKRRERSAKKDVSIRACKDIRKRKALELDIEKWLRFFFSEIFTYEFTAQQKEMIAAIRGAIEIGGDQSIAASRGEGKTTLAECVLVYCVLTGIVKFAVLFAATGDDASNSLESIKSHLAENEVIAAYYPEVCDPIIALENTPNRAHYQTVSGKRADNGKPFSQHPSKFSWCGREVRLPDVPGSKAARAIIATRGLDSAVRGLKIDNRRPELAVIDDPDTIDTANSEAQAAKLEAKIDKAIAGLGGQQRRIARVMLTTLQNRTCVSYKFTDPAQKPSWHGKRFRFLIVPPERIDMWEEFVSLQEKDWDAGTTYAHDFYIANKSAMDAGAVVANQYRFVPGEASALEHYFVWVAKIKQASVSTEFDNDPPEDEGPIESGVSASNIQYRLSDYPRRIVPPNCTLLTQGIDVQKAGLHWVVKAWQADATNYVVDYGFFETHGTIYGSDDGIEFAVRRAVLGRIEEAKALPCTTADGDPVPIALTLIDSGWQAPTIYQACAEIGLGIYPSKGHGRSHGCATPNFYDVLKRTRDRKPGDGWFMTRQQGNVWLVHCDTDRWKSFEHARWMTQDGKPGAAYVFGEMTEEERRYVDRRMPREVKEHHGFARHLTAEIEVEEVVRGVLKRFWKVKAGRVQNHYFDASYLADVAAAMQGIRLLGETKVKSGPATRPTAKELAAQSRRVA